jgi:hypothetical protein
MMNYLVENEKKNNAKQAKKPGSGHFLSSSARPNNSRPSIFDLMVKILCDPCSSTPRDGSAPARPRAAAAPARFRFYAEGGIHGHISVIFLQVCRLLLYVYWHICFLII